MSEEAVDGAKRATLRRFAALGTLPLAAGASEADTIESEPSLSREAIAGYVVETPGAHFSKIRDDLHLGTGEAQHHLRRLLSDGVLESLRDGDYRRFYQTGRFSEFEQVALGYLRRETARGMLVALLRDPSKTGAEIARELDVSRATVSAWAGRLESAGLLEKQQGYGITRPETLLMLVVRYGDSMGRDAGTLARNADEYVSFDP